MYSKGVCTCDFCNRRLTDEGLGFYKHIESRPECAFLWDEWKQRISRDWGGGD